MTPKDFITQCVQKISLAFPQLTVSYKFDESSDTHFLKVIPEDYYSSDEFMKLEANIYSDWYSQTDNLDHGFCIISSSSLIQLEDDKVLYKPEVEISAKWNEDESLLFLELTKLAMTDSLKGYNFGLVGSGNLEDDYDDKYCSQFAMAA